MDIFEKGVGYLALWEFLVRNARRYASRTADVEDIAQEALLRLWKYMPEGGLGAQALQARAYVSLKHSAIDFKRRCQSMPVLFPYQEEQSRVDDLVEDLETPESLMRAQELLEHALECEDLAHVRDTLLTTQPNTNKYKVRRFRLRARMKQRLLEKGYFQEGV